MVEWLKIGIAWTAIACSQCRSPSRVDAGRDTAPSGKPELASPSAAASPAVLDPRAYGDRDAGERDTPTAAPPASPEPRSKKCVVAAFGDSLTDPRSHGGKYLATLRKQRPESQFDSYGKGGDMVNQMKKRFIRDLIDAPPAPDALVYTHVVIFGGVNDLYSDETAGRTVEGIENDLAFMYDAARERGLRVVAITVSPWGGFRRYYNERRGDATRRLNAWILDQARLRRVDHVVDAYSILSCGDPERLCARYEEPFKDGLHFGPAGHERLAEALLETAFSGCR